MPLTPTETRQLLEGLGHRPRKPLGQNFLVDGNIVRKSLQLASIEEGDTVVEIGPGLGTLTRALLEAGAVVHAVELDPALAAHMRESLCPQFPDTFHLVEGDALDHPRAGLPPQTEAFKVVANLPYAITTPWMEAILQHPLPSGMVLMMQKEAADRLTAQPGSKAYGAVSVFLAGSYAKAGLHRVARSCFYPVPGVDSILLHLRRLNQPYRFPTASRALIRDLFTRRRKQIGSLLAGHPNAQSWLDQLPSFNCSHASRPEEIPFEAWKQLASDR
jgi:16S rRNA (adenine1518-N6/adenine1519-N6)-dimethyltransferase